LNNDKYSEQYQKAFKSTAATFDNYNDIDSCSSYDVSQTLQGDHSCNTVGIDKIGITNPTTIYRNLTYKELYDHECASNEGLVAEAEYGKTFAVSTGKFTGRSPKDKFMVFNSESQSADHIDWNTINQQTSPEVFDELEQKAVDYFNTLDKLYVFDCYVGASPSSRKKIRFVVSTLAPSTRVQYDFKSRLKLLVSSLVVVVNLKHEMAWQQHFCTNMFIRPVDPEELDDFEPDFTVMNACAEKVEDWERLGLNSETAVLFNIEKGKALIFGTYYGGENKKGIFSLMNYLLPLSNPPQLPMHCSANVGKNDDVCLFFGLSGTGKTTLSADPHRALIGDDEHGK